MTTNATLDDFIDFNDPQSTDILTTSFAQIRKIFNGYNENLGGDADITLTNPLSSLQNISFSEAGHKVILPPMDRANSIAPGAVPGVAIRNAGSDSFDILAQDGSTVVFSGLTAGQIVFISLKENQSTNGTFVTQLISTGSGGGDLLAANNLSDVDDIDISRQNLLAPKTSANAGDPNGAVAGEVGDFCINTSGSNALYMCTTAGDAASAAWTLQGGSSAGDLLAANNLSDVDNIDESRQNLSAPKMTTNEGNPNTHVAGEVGDFCVDILADWALYKCISAGDAAAAVWTLQGNLVATNNLSDLTDLATARSNLAAPAMRISEGNPNFSQAGAAVDGNEGDLCIDSVSGNANTLNLYMCVQPGLGGSAVWELKSGLRFTRPSNGPTSINGVSQIINDMALQLEASSTYHLKAKFIVDVGNVLTDITLGVTDDALLGTANTLTAVSGLISAKDAINNVVASSYTTEVYGLDSGVLTPGAVATILFDIDLIFTTGVAAHTLLFWLTATEAEGATLKAKSFYTLDRIL